MAHYAKVIVNLSADAVDRAFTYRIPDALSASVFPGVRVDIPFGNAKKLRTGYVAELTDEAGYDEAKVREIAGISKGALTVDEEMLALAAFLAGEYGSTMNQALKTVLPVKRTVRKNGRRTDPMQELEKLYGAEENRKEIRKAEAPDGGTSTETEMPEKQLNAGQASIVEDMKRRDRAGGAERRKPSLLFGITGSGKTMVYIQLIEYIRASGRQAIVLIPEISLTYQTVRELWKFFGDRVSVLHSRLSQGERYEQYEKARRGEIDVMVGPRSALFAPFARLGLIIIDEEHEASYHSDTSPRYDAREAARKRAELSDAMLLLGSATPSLLSYYRAEKETYTLYRLTERAVRHAVLPRIHISDMRKELAAGNRSLFSRELYEMIGERLEKKEQVMLFLNRRGYAGFVSCRSCGYVVRCPHCEVSLTAHNNWYFDRRTGKRSAALLTCHYCGYRAPMPESCPSCRSPYIAPFGTGTQKVEALVRKMFPKARLLRMDADTTAAKGAHEHILNTFARGDADILLGTQMIVKGHDFPRVTLVGILAADLSLYASDYDAAERTFQLLMQASGRAGRGSLQGDVVIQTYDPSHYVIETAAKQDYETFYRREMSYRRLMKYPPTEHLLAVRFSSGSEESVKAASEAASAFLEPLVSEAGGILIGPCDPTVPKVRDQYRKILYLKHESHDIIIKIREELHAFMQESLYQRDVQFTYDLQL